MRVFGTSTLHDFEGTAPCTTFVVEPRAADGSYRARVEVTISEIDTGNGMRNTRMREMFEADRHPTLVGTFDRIEPAALREQKPGALDFRLAIRGVERSVSPRVEGWSESPETSAKFRAAFDLSLREFGLEAPVAMGFIKVDDRVRVEVDVELSSQPIGMR